MSVLTAPKSRSYVCSAVPTQQSVTTQQQPNRQSSRSDHCSCSYSIDYESSVKWVAWRRTCSARRTPKVVYLMLTSVEDTPKKRSRTLVGKVSLAITDSNCGCFQLNVRVTSTFHANYSSATRNKYKSTRQRIMSYNESHSVKSSWRSPKSQNIIVESS